jgi:NAD(P)H-nitrite reductase large subunit
MISWSSLPAAAHGFPHPGNDLKNVTSVTNLDAAQAVQQQCAARKINNAVIIGAGFIGWKWLLPC